MQSTVKGIDPISFMKGGTPTPEVSLRGESEGPKSLSPLYASAIIATGTIDKYMVCWDIRT